MDDICEEVQVVRKSQKQHILEWLQAGNPITALEALVMFGCFRLAARICDLRAEGHPIKDKDVQRIGTVSGEPVTLSMYWLEAA